MWRWILIAVFALVIGAGVYVLGIMNAWYGVLEGPGSSADATRPAESVAERAKEQQRAASRLSSSESPQILFGDLHRAHHLLDGCLHVEPALLRR